VTAGAPDGRAPRQPRLGLALSGGTARTIAHIGVLRALAEAGIRVDCVAGTSGGALIASFFAAGLPMAEIERRALTIRWKDLATVTLPRIGFLSSQPIQHFVTQAIGDLTFSQLKLPFAVVATHLATGQKRVFTAGNVALAVRASCSIPQIFTPCEVDGELYIDGGIVEYLPVMALDPFAPQVVLAVNLGAYRDPLHRPKHILQMIMQIVTVVSKQNMPASEARASYVIRPNLSKFGPFALERAHEMIRIGHDEAARCMPDIARILKREASPLRRLVSGLTGLRP
jgi:NTE family protein